MLDDPDSIVTDVFDNLQIFPGNLACKIFEDVAFNKISQSYVTIELDNDYIKCDNRQAIIDYVNYLRARFVDTYDLHMPADMAYLQGIECVDIDTANNIIIENSTSAFVNPVLIDCNTEIELYNGLKVKRYIEKLNKEGITVVYYAVDDTDLKSPILSEHIDLDLYEDDFGVTFTLANYKDLVVPKVIDNLCLLPQSFLDVMIEDLDTETKTRVMLYSWNSYYAGRNIGITMQNGLEGAKDFAAQLDALGIAPNTIDTLIEINLPFIMDMSNDYWGVFAAYPNK